MLVGLLFACVSSGSVGGANKVVMTFVPGTHQMRTRVTGRLTNKVD